MMRARIHVRKHSREVPAGILRKSERFGFEPEVTAKLAKSKRRDGVQALWYILRYRILD